MTSGKYRDTRAGHAREPVYYPSLACTNGALSTEGPAVTISHERMSVVAHSIELLLDDSTDDRYRDGDTTTESVIQGRAC